ncbi:acyl-CoA synthetase [Iodidimonas muriae]|uniref:Acyl-CoA synthetase n=1 Tax=Iodidimonas muriae TaxID=261467 RepID=A0ABQ2LDG5_9PROT|nr:long-chain-fatty-acid--CoA ligase [Iodidimonas muriae]GER07445.1 acyl-CoA synthetase [Kordiimonadales bacterium JCM 17843]GGO10479.1 acyl-CoA synthetase [Iodidimonas muriae]
MLGLMQDWPLLQSKLIEHAARFHPRREIVTYSVEGPVHRTNYAELHGRSKQLAQALERLGVQKGDRVGTLAWNTWRHVELWFGVAGMGAVAHTVNPRLFAEQVVYIINHAADKVLCLDLTFVPLIEPLLEHLKSVEHFVILTDRAHMPKDTKIPNPLCYEDMLDVEDGVYEWPELDENTAAGLCYTSGTTGEPKGVLYSNRSNVLHTMAAAATDTLGVSARDAVLPVVPMFHANSWGVPYLAAMTGAKLVLNGPHHDPQTMWRILDEEQVSVTAAVPTIWMALLKYLQETGKKLPYLKNVTIGGSAAPRSMVEAFERDYDVSVSHAWGMTEMSPLGTVGTHTADTASLDFDDRIDVQCKQGRAVFGVELRIVDAEGKILPHDGVAFGHLQARGPWTAKAYYNRPDDILDMDGFFDTGDVSIIDPNGFMQITDRSKDVIKSGGEWISSIDLENAAVGHPDVLEAAVIGIVHPKWDERPLLVIVPEPGKTVSRDDMLAFLTGKVAKWWLPDDVVCRDSIPHTATGKIHKAGLREQFKDYRFPNV